MLYCDSGFDDRDSGWYYYHAHGFNNYQKKRRTRCCSCKKVISQDDVIVCFSRYRDALTDVEEKIMGQEIRLADYYLCEKCGEIYFNLEDLGYAIDITASMADYMAEYLEIVEAEKAEKAEKRQKK